MDASVMPACRIPQVIKGFAVVRFPDGRSAGDYVGGQPREAGVCATPSSVGAARMADAILELSGKPRLVKGA